MVATPSPVSTRNVSASLSYVLSEVRHDGKRSTPRNHYVESFGCMPETAAAEFRRVRQDHGKNSMKLVTTENGQRYEGEFVQGLTLIFSADDSEPGEMEGFRSRVMRVAKELVDDGDGDWQAVLAFQDDGHGGKRHAHMVMNTVHPTTGKSMSGNHRAKDINQLRDLVDAVWLEDGLDNKALHAQRRSLRLRPYEKEAKKAGQYVWKEDLSERLRSALEESTDRGSLKEAAATHGVSVKYHGRGISYGFTDSTGQDHSIRARDLGTAWSAKTVDGKLSTNLLVKQVEEAEVAEEPQAATAPPKKVIRRVVKAPAPTVSGFSEVIASHKPAQAPATPGQAPAAEEPQEATQPPKKVIRRVVRKAKQQESEQAAYDVEAALADQPYDLVIALREISLKGQGSALDLVHEQAKLRQEMLGCSSAEAFAEELNTPLLKDGQGGSASPKERAEARVKVSPLRTELTYSEGQQRARASQERLKAAMEAVRATPRQEPRDQSSVWSL